MEATTYLQQAPRGVEPEVAPGNPAIGAMFLSFFGTIWLVVGCLCNSAPYHLAAAVSGATGLLIFAAAFAAAAQLRKQRPENAEPTLAEQRRDRSFNRINLAQWSACGLAALALNVFGHPEWIMASIILIVGLHFLPLARVFQRRSLAILGLIVVFIALAVPQFVEDGPQSVALPLATGCVLLAFAALNLRHARLRLHG